MLREEGGALILAWGSWTGVDIVFLRDYMNREGRVYRGGDIWAEPLIESRSFPDRYGSLKISSEGPENRGDLKVYSKQCISICVICNKKEHLFPLNGM